MKWLFVGALAAAGTTLHAGEALADEPHARIAGIGTLLAGGYGNGIMFLGLQYQPYRPDGPITFSNPGGEGDADALTLDLQFFNRFGHSVDISIPATKMMLPFFGAWIVNTDFFYNFNVGRGIPRLIVGPGIGYTVSSDGNRTAGALRFPSEIGLELLTKSHGFGFKVLARPFWEIAHDVDRWVPAAGFFAGIAFTGYVHK